MNITNSWAIRISQQQMTGAQSASVGVYDERIGVLDATGPGSEQISTNLGLVLQNHEPLRLTTSCRYFAVTGWYVQACTNLGVNHKYATSTCHDVHFGSLALHLSYRYTYFDARAHFAELRELLPEPMLFQERIATWQMGSKEQRSKWIPTPWSKWDVFLLFLISSNFHRKLWRYALLLQAKDPIQNVPDLNQSCPPQPLGCVAVKDSMGQRQVSVMSSKCWMWTVRCLQSPKSGLVLERDNVLEDTFVFSEFQIQMHYVARNNLARNMIWTVHVQQWHCIL